jgi:hypothetical protein
MATISASDCEAEHHDQPSINVWNRLNVTTRQVVGQWTD